MDIARSMLRLEVFKEKTPLDVMIIFFRVITLIVFGIYLYSTYSLIDYRQFLRFDKILYIFVVIKDLAMLLIFYLFTFAVIIGREIFGLQISQNAGYLILIGFTNISPDFPAIVENPANWLIGILNHFVSGLMSLFVLIIALMILGYINTGKVDFGIWVFFLAELSLILAVIFNMQSFAVPVMKTPADFARSPLLTHSIIALVFIESMTQLSYFSTFLMPLKERIKRNTVVINRFESLTPEAIAEGVEEETKETRILEKLSPVAAYFTSEYHVSPIQGYKFSMRYLAKLKNYYDFISSKDPELRDKLVGLKTIPTWSDAVFRSLLYLILKIIIVVGLAFLVLSLPQYYSLTFLGSRIFELSLIEFYIIYVGTAVMFLFVLGELIRKL